VSGDPDVDEVAVERACKGDRTVHLNRAEMAAAIDRLERRGLSANDIAEVLGTTSRTVVRSRTGDTSLPYSRPGEVVDNTRDKIAAALNAKVPAVRRAATKAQKALAELDSTLAEWDAKEQALERIADLERELAEAKAVLRGPAKAATPQRGGVHARARAWARQQGIQVPQVGRVPLEVIEAWEQATGTAA